MTVARASGREGTDRRRARLIELIRDKSLLRGPEFTLASGATSTFYFNMKPTAFDPEGANLIAELILEALAGEPVDLVGGLEMGAVPIVAGVCQKSFPARPLAGFFVRKTPKDHGTRRLIEGLAPDATLAGKRAVLIEDVTTTGGSVQKAIRAARDEGCSVETVVTVVDRLEGAEDNLAKEGVALIALLTAEDFDI